jgi:hypothetical protein
LGRRAPGAATLCLRGKGEGGTVADGTLDGGSGGGAAFCCGVWEAGRFRGATITAVMQLTSSKTITTKNTSKTPSISAECVIGHLPCLRQLSGPRCAGGTRHGQRLPGSVVGTETAHQADTGHGLSAGGSGGCCHRCAGLKRQPGTREDPGWFVNRRPKVTLHAYAVQA